MVHLLLEYGNNCDLGLTRYKDGFLNRLHLPHVDLQYPEYKVTDEDEKDGYEKNLNKYRLVEKIFTVKGLFPEYLMDSITMLPLLDIVRFYAIDGRVYEANNVTIEHEWTSDNGFADTTIKFTCESVSQDYCCNNMTVDCYDQHPSLTISERGFNTFRLTATDFPPNAWAEITVNDSHAFHILGTFNTNSFEYIDYENTFYDRLYAYPRVYNFSCSYGITQNFHDYTDYIRNGTFESWNGSSFPSWVSYAGQGLVTADHNNAYTGYYACMLYRAIPGNNPSVSQIINGMPYGQYRLSFFAKADAERLIEIQFNRGTDSKEYLGMDSNWNLVQTFMNFNLTTAWTEVELIFETNAVQHSIYMGTANASTVYIDKVTLIKIG